MIDYRVAILACVMHCVSAFEWMFPIDTTIVNATGSGIDLYCQASGPAVDRYGEGFAYETWPVTNLPPNQEQNVQLWIFKDDSSKLKVSILGTAEGTGELADETTVAHLKNNSQYFGDLTLLVDACDEKLLASVTGNIEGNVSGQNGSYKLSLVVR